MEATKLCHRSYGTVQVMYYACYLEFNSFIKRYCEIMNMFEQQTIFIYLGWIPIKVVAESARIVYTIKWWRGYEECP